MTKAPVNFFFLFFFFFFFVCLFVWLELQEKSCTQSTHYLYALTVLEHKMIKLIKALTALVGRLSMSEDGKMVLNGDKIVLFNP